jgi:hypothetical protein
MVNSEHYEEEKEGIGRNNLAGSDSLGFNNDVGMPPSQM